MIFLDDNATTLVELNARKEDAKQSDAGCQRGLTIVTMPTPGFVLQNTATTSSSTIDHSPSAQHSTSISSRRTLQVSNDPTLSLHAHSTGDDRAQGS
ncbi:hypothetical protein A2U01_0001660 [Trifolium medium]|uniref:Uncharacterized protein n=1 Tax=Trifolium medium TaxID=97028 RepID=A0A392M2Q0_9FABA|nr:hypothetical protein [Trifolium medium]